MKIWLDERKGLVLGRTKWVGGTLKKCKTIGGYRYLKPTQTASWPLTMGTLHRLRDVFGDQLEVDPKLYQWARLQHRVANDVHLKEQMQHVAPKLAQAIESRAYQVAGVSRIATQSKLALTDEPSLGKTLQSLGGLIAGDDWNGRHLVICPKTAINSTWSRQILKWTDGQVFPVTGRADQKRAAIGQFLSTGSGPRFVITNPETLRVKTDKYCRKCERWQEQIDLAQHEGRVGHQLRWQIRQQDYPELFNVPWTSIIADECDRYLLALRPGAGKMPQWGEGLARLGADRKIAMTGTPFHGKEINLFGILHWLDPVRFSSFWGHVEQYFEERNNGFGREIVGIREDSREAYQELLDVFMLRRTKLEAKPDLPDELHQDHLIDMSPIQRRAYEDFEELGWARLHGEGDALRSQGVLSRLTRLQQLAFGEMMTRSNKLVPVASEKYEWLLAALSERGIKVKGVNTGHMKYVVVSRFTFILDWLSEKLQGAGIGHMMLTGDVTGKRRDDTIASFQSRGGPRVLLLNTMAGGVSIDLDAWCDEMFILDETFIEDEMEQVRGRINNRGERVAPRTFHYLRMAETIEERMADDNIRQALMQHGLLDGRRGLEMAARLMGRTL